MDTLFVQNTFSIAVAAFLLIRMEREMRVLREAIDRLRYCQICRFSPVITIDDRSPRTPETPEKEDWREVRI